MYGVAPAAPTNLKAEEVRVNRQLFDGKATKSEVLLSFGPPGTPPISLLVVLPNKRPASGKVPMFVGVSFCGITRSWTNRTSPFRKCGCTSTAPVARTSGPPRRGAAAKRICGASTCSSSAATDSRCFTTATSIRTNRTSTTASIRTSARPALPDARKLGERRRVGVGRFARRRLPTHAGRCRHPPPRRLRTLAVGEDGALRGGRRRANRPDGATPVGDRRLRSQSRQRPGTVERINRVFPHWFNDHFAAFGDKPEQVPLSKLPIDQHLLIALVAPRAVFDTEGSRTSGRISTTRSGRYRRPTRRSSSWVRRA